MNRFGLVQPLDDSVGIECSIMSIFFPPLSSFCNLPAINIELYAAFKVPSLASAPISFTPGPFSLGATVPLLFDTAMPFSSPESYYGSFYLTNARQFVQSRLWKLYYIIIFLTI